MPSPSAYRPTGVSLTLDVALSRHSCSSKVQILLLTLDVGYLLLAARRSSATPPPLAIPTRLG